MRYRPSFEQGPADVDEAMPAPFLMNCWKHHAGVIVDRIAAAVAGGDGAVRELPRRLLVIGEDLMDLYLGSLSPETIAAEVSWGLAARGLDPPARTSAWIAEGGGYAVLELSDGSRWVLRESPLVDRPLHVHPARDSVLCLRVRANVLKTAIVSLAWARLHRRDPLETAVVNEARRELLGLSPVPRIRKDEGLGEVIACLAARGA